MSGRLILGIESSCDDTAAALVTEVGEVLASVIAPQVEVHSPFGGVYPEFASRAHVVSVIPTIQKVMADAGATPADLAAIGVTRGPGLIGSLLVGLNTAAGLGVGWNVPVIGVNHLRGHLRSADLEQARVKYPAIVLLVSGGHSFLARMTGPGEIALLGTTRDDSVGEAFDKVGRMLGLPFPAGPAMDRLAAQGQPVFKFPRPMLNEGLEFSFSGLKSSVARHMEKHPDAPLEDVAASFVAACLDILETKCRRALTQYPSVALVVVGGVSASPPLRARMAEMCEGLGVELCLPPLRWSTDNAAMIALAAWDYLRAGLFPPAVPEVRLPITQY
jgi:N6-L-threonylcarbamoyladenine synthase